MPRRRRRIEKWLAGSETPVFVLDTDRVVAWFNTGCERLTGWLAQDVIGWRCDYSSEFEAGTAAAARMLAEPVAAGTAARSETQVAQARAQLGWNQRSHAVRRETAPTSAGPR